MGGDSAFLAMLKISGFLGAAWSATKASQALGVSSIVAEIAVGVILGPSIVGLVSPQYVDCEFRRYIDCEPEGGLGALRATVEHHGALPEALDRDVVLEACDYEAYHGHGGHHDDGHHLKYDSYEQCLVSTCMKDLSSHCQQTPEVFTLVGHIGVAMMIFESGMHFDFKMAKVVGPWACVVAVIGTIGPLVVGGALAMIYGDPLMPDALVAGTALAPTSVGISLRLLGEAGVLSQEFGQTIMTAAFVDDILSLVLFNIIFSIGDGHLSFEGTFLPAILGIAFMIFAVGLAVVFWPRFLQDFVIGNVPEKKGDFKLSRQDELLFLCMLLMLIAYGLITYLCGTHLWGCFIAGMSFACFQPEHYAASVWVKQTKRLTSWMIRIFFCSTVAFAIPVQELLSIEAFWKGAIMGIGACIMPKVLCAFYMGKPRWVIGWAMVGRAEFAYLIAQMGAAGNLISKKTFSILIWALLWATVFAPFVFRAVLNKYIRDNNIEIDKPGHGGHAKHDAWKDDDAEHENPDSVDPADIDLDTEPHKPKTLGNPHGGAVKPWDEDLLEGGKESGSAGKRGARTVKKSSDGKNLCCLFFK
mmetsp:Transcript_56314/g.158741  ORF Transcript_56314/g.158741 Transcript_56314/m.158741 type:complete len:585 (+) Transcript_56314:78-1832(+)